MNCIRLTGILFTLAALVSCSRAGNRNIIDSEKTYGAGRYCSLTSSGGILTVYYTRGADSRIMTARSADLAKTWKITNVVFSTNIYASGDPVAFFLSENGHSMAFKNGKKIDVLDSGNGDNGWYHARSKAEDPSRNFVIWRGDNRLVVCYTKAKQNNSLYSAYSADNGSNWTTHTIDDTAQSQGGKNLSLVSTGPGSLIVAYNGAYHGKGKGKSLKVAYSSDYGASWKRVIEIDGPECSVGNNESMASDGSNTLIIYSSGRGMKYAISPLSAMEWNTGFITNTNGQAYPAGYSLSLVFHDGRGHFSYYDGKSISIYSCLITNGGLTVTGSRKVENIPFYIEGLKTSLAVCSNSVVLVYYHPQEKCLKYFSMKSGN